MQMKLIQEVDFEAIKKKELEKSKKTFQFNQISRETLYNMIQDLRHLIMIDVRNKDEYNKSHIRDSFMLAGFHDQKENMLVMFDEADKKIAIQEEKYSTKKIRRLVIIDSNQNPFDEKKLQHKFVMDCVKENRDFDKVSYLQGGFENFEKKYPFLCLNFDERDQVKKTDFNNMDTSHIMDDSKTDHTDILTSYEKKLFYSYCRFPTEAITDTIYIGNVFNSNNKKQIEDLNIKSMIDLMDYKEPNANKDFKEKNYSYKNIPLNEEIISMLDFDEICQHIDQEIKADKKPILIYCGDGDTFSPAIVIAYLMWSKKQGVDIASMLIFQKRSTVKINKLLYSMLQIYTPGTSKVKKF